jgi:hypothetical protein
VLSPAEIAAWNEAYVTVESYFSALGLRNKWLLGRLLQRVLERAQVRVRENPALPPPTVAMEETIRLVAEWFSRESGVQLPENRLAARGRLALYLSGFSRSHQEYFLAEQPLPPELSEKLRESYLRAGPKFQNRTMTPRPIRLNSLMTSANRWWELLNRAPVFKFLVVASFLIALAPLLLVFFWR